MNNIVCDISIVGGVGKRAKKEKNLKFTFKNPGEKDIWINSYFTVWDLCLKNFDIQNNDGDKAEYFGPKPKKRPDAPNSEKKFWRKIKAGGGSNKVVSGSKIINYYDLPEGKNLIFRYATHDVHAVDSEEEKNKDSRKTTKIKVKCTNYLIYDTEKEDFVLPKED